MKRLTIFMALLPFCTLYLNAQNYSSVEDVDFLNKHEHLVKDVHPNLDGLIEIVGVEKVDEIHTIVEYKAGGTHFQSIVNNGRKDMLLIANYKEIEEGEMPQVILDRLPEDGDSQWTEVAYYEVQEPSSEKFYAVEFEKEGEEKRLHFNQLGQYHDDPL